jgi:hypothetical protein
MANRRTARQVIDQAIADNRKQEWILYSFSITCVLTGLVLILWGLFHGDKIFAGLGTLSSALFWPAMRYARQIRRESIAIRLLEVPLSKAETETAACAMLERFFRDLMLDKSKDGLPSVYVSTLPKPEERIEAPNTGDNKVPEIGDQKVGAN